MTIVFKVSDNVKEKMLEFYKNCFRDNKPPYSVFQAKSADVIITLYESGKVMFQGISADIEANIWKDQEKHLNNRNIDLETKKKEEKKDDDIKSYFNISAIGSDEVGTGDYFGPIVVTASYVPKEMETELRSLGVKDSKLLSDQKICDIASSICNKIIHKSYILNNVEFNELTKNGNNMNKIKAILHNKVLYEVKNSNIKYDKIVVDQFTFPYKYYEYLKNEKTIVTNISFTPRAESKNLAVACSSIISRYIFLQEMDKISKQTGIELPKGAGTDVDIVGAKIIEKFGYDKLYEIAKINFKNTEKIKKIVAK